MITLEIIKEIRSVPTDCNGKVWKGKLAEISRHYGIGVRQIVRIYHAKTIEELLKAAEG